MHTTKMTPMASDLFRPRTAGIRPKGDAILFSSMIRVCGVCGVYGACCVCCVCCVCRASRLRLKKASSGPSQGLTVQSGERERKREKARCQGGLETELDLPSDDAEGSEAQTTCRGGL